MNKSNPATPVRLPAPSSVPAGAALAVLYAILATLSNDDSGMELFHYLVLYWAAAAIMLLYWISVNRGDNTVSLREVLAWAVVFRVIGWTGTPVLEDDFYRYLLDGCLTASSGSPYGIVPATLFAGNALPAECKYALNWINNPDLPTIYAPLLQYLFWFCHLISPADIRILQAVLVVLDIAMICLLGRIAPARHVMLYAWCPLVLKEIAFTAHPDVVGALLLLAAFVCRRQRRFAVASTLAGLACCTKIFAVLALPYFLLRKDWRVWAAAVLPALTVYLPFLIQGSTHLPVLGTFARYWEFNALGYGLMQKLLPDLLVRPVCLTLFVCWWVRYLSRCPARMDGHSIPRMDWIFGMFFVLSPVVNPWYLIWILPYAVLYPSYWAWSASAVVSLSYVTGLNIPDYDLAPYEIHVYARIAEYLVMMLALILDFKAGRLAFRAHGRTSVKKSA